MLNKEAEKVLKCIIEKFDGNFDEMVDISHKDIKDKKITNNLINSICSQLNKEGYIGNSYPSINEDDFISVYLNHEGYSYFDNKRTNLFQTWFPIILSNLIAFVALIISIIALLK